ncbi:aminoglycoside phosphotransferase family protein [Falsibacillus albus]|nr:aminoglycoside phosphotransferase family protein [Falsibacillus albus]
MTIPLTFQKTIIGMHKEKGEKWLQELPDFLLNWQKQQEATLLSPFELSYNYVAPVLLSNGRSAVFKISYPSKEFLREVQTYQAFQQGKFVRMLDCSLQDSWVLMEYLSPGTPLKESGLSDLENVSIAAGILPTLWSAPDFSNFPTVREWSKGLERLRSRFSGNTGPLPAHCVEKAEKLYDELFASEREVHLLHGDLHHGNILFDGDQGWTAIDAKGVIGEKEYDCIQFMINELQDQQDRLSVLRDRISRFCDVLQLDRERMIAWGFCHSVLSAAWCIEDGQNSWEWGIGCAGLFDELMQE